mmetsp:Transcript_64722/g.127927  ORF Transcript_64722/g.127927 Transcript_64722/m.127927 type:complete len:333 (+) Transcript_64722:322-1320(+)
MELQRALNRGVGAHVDGGGGLVEREYFAALEQRSRHADELALASRQVGAILLERSREALRVVADGRGHRALLEQAPERVVVVLVEGVKVVPKAAREEHWILRDDGELRAQRRELEGREVDAVEDDATARHVDKPEEGDEQGRLAAPGAAAYADPRATFDRERAALEDGGQLGSVPHDHRLEGKGSTARPPVGRQRRRRLLLGEQPRVGSKALHRDHHGLHSCEALQQAVEHLGQCWGSREGEAGIRSRPGARRAVLRRLVHREDGGEREHDRAESLEPDGQPIVHDAREEAGPPVVVHPQQVGLAEALVALRRLDGGRAVEGLGEGGIDRRL